MSNYQQTQHAMNGKPLFPDNGARAPMAGGGMTYVEPPKVYRRKPHMCSANENTCKCPKALGTELCIGHLKGKEKQERLAAEEAAE